MSRKAMRIIEVIKEYIIRNLIDIIFVCLLSLVLVKMMQSESENCYKVIKGSWKHIQETAKQE